MKQSQVVHSSIQKIKDAINRLTAAHKAQPELHAKGPEDHFTIAQIGEHLAITIEKYLPNALQAVSSGEACSSDDEHVPTFLGKAIYKAAGPEGNPPIVPKMFRPADRPENGLERAISGHRDLLAIAERAKGLDLNAVKVATPIGPMFQVNLGDFLLAQAAHAERHVGQIERRL